MALAESAASARLAQFRLVGGNVVGAVLCNVREEVAMDFHHLDDTQGEFPPELAPHFQGEMRLQPFSSPFADGPTIFAVHFQPGGRTKPHTHAAGQILHVTAGQGYIATAAERRLVGPGDIAVVMPGEWHWHGATPTSAMTHVTTQMTGPDAVDWDVEERDWASGYEA